MSASYKRFKLKWISLRAISSFKTYPIYCRYTMKTIEPSAKNEGEIELRAFYSTETTPKIKNNSLKSMI